MGQRQFVLFGIVGVVALVVAITVAGLNDNLTYYLYPKLFLGELDQNTHRLNYVNSGHPPALLVAADGTVQELGATGMPAGLMDIVMPTKYELAVVDFPPGATLVVYSDGISEAESGDEQFGEGRLVKCVQGCAGLGAEDTLKCVLESVAAFIGDQPQPDDVTLLVVHRKG
jgi:sigma-B regulation protein RsbU (phosphoserine phosphatase)